MWLEDIFNQNDSRQILQELLPNVREVIECSCNRCDFKGYVLPGLTLDLTKTEHKTLYGLYMAQKPLLCQVCQIYYCQKCAREGLMSLDCSTNAKRRIAENEEKWIAEQSKNQAYYGGKEQQVAMPAFCLECGEIIDYA